MLKPASLRQHLTAATPELRTNPDKLSLYIGAGKIAAAGTGSLSFEYRYTLTLTVLDYASHADAILVPLLAWLKRNQVEVFDTPEQRDKAVRFEAEFLNAETVDLRIELDLSERVLVTPGQAPADPATAQRFTITHVPEPGRIDLFDSAERWELYLRDQLIAAWDYPPTFGDVPA